MLEKHFEMILAKYPELIENGLQLKGRQVSMFGRRMDLLFEDIFGRKLIVELKVGPIKDRDLGQILCYEGMLLSPDDPTIRVMLISNRVPHNIRRSLDHHGIAWKEISLSSLVDYLKVKEDSEMLGLLPQEEFEVPLSRGHQKAVEIKGNAPVEISRDSKEHECSENGQSLTRSNLKGYSASLTNKELRQLCCDQFIENPIQKRMFMSSPASFKFWGNYIAALLLDENTKIRGVAEWFPPKDIKIMLKNLMPCHYDRKGMFESGLLTSDVEVHSKYNQKFPCLERDDNTGMYRFVGFPES